MVDNSNASVTNFITRGEYESRHAELQTRIISLDTKMDSLSNKIDQLGTDISKSGVKMDLVKSAVINIVNLLVGAGVIVIAQFVITHHF